MTTDPTPAPHDDSTVHPITIPERTRMHIDDATTLGDLRKALATMADLPNDTPVILAKDTVGSSFGPLAEITDGRYLATSTYSGERYISHSELDAALTRTDNDWAEEDRAPASSVPAIFLWPTN